LRPASRGARSHHGIAIPVPLLKRYNTPVTAHDYLVLFLAADECAVATLVVGMTQVAASGERFPLFSCLSHVEASNAVRRCVEAGYIELHLRDAQHESSALTQAEALSLVSDTFALSDESALWRHELVLTATGEAAYVAAPRALRAEIDAAETAAEQASKQFVAEHPGHYERMAEWLEAVGRWVDEGGDPPPHPYKDDWPGTL
jgi:hypothetical protein